MKGILEAYEGLSVLLGILSLLLVAPLLHESFHQIALEMMSCPYVQDVKLHLPLSATTQPLCQLEGWMNSVYLLSGVIGSVAVSQMLFLVSMRSPRVVALPSQALSSSILLSNGLSLLSPVNDMALLGLPEAGWLAGAVLSMAAVAQFFAVERIKSREEEI